MRRIFFAGILVVAWATGAAAGPADYDRNVAEHAFQTGDYERAGRLLRPFAEMGDAGAQSSLGWMYLNGQGVPQSDQDALNWYRNAAEQGYAAAQSGLGWMYLNGQGVPQNDQEALKWYRLAAKQGYAEAQMNLSVIFAEGRGVPKNFVRALMWANLAVASSNDDEGKTAKELRDELASRMTAIEIGMAQNLARQCREPKKTQMLLNGINYCD